MRTKCRDLTTRVLPCYSNHAFGSPPERLAQPSNARAVTGGRQRGGQMVSQGSGNRGRSFALFTLVSVLLAGCAEDTDGTSSARTEPAAGEIGAPEQSDVVVAIPYSDGGLEQRYFIATDEGYLDEPGLTIEVVTADDPRAAVVSGSADIGMIGAGSAIQAVDQGLEIDIVAGHACRQQYSFATASDVQDVNDLAGSDVLLADSAGDPARFERKQVLAEEGWDLDSVSPPVNEVIAGSGVAVESFLAGQVGLIYYFSEDVPRLEKGGANFPVSELRPWPNDLYIASEDWVAENPNTLAHFLRAEMQAVEFISAPGIGETPENLDQVLEYWRQHGFEDEAADVETTPGPYGLGTEEMCPNLYYDEEAWDTTIGLARMDVTIPFEDATNLDQLGAAQASLGLDNSPPAEIPWPPPAE
jgi:NitT/TauT family transport system substrate-binding protein